MNQSLPVIPKRGQKVSAQELVAIEKTIAELVPTINDFDWLEETRAQARALESYLRDKEMQTPMRGTQRRIEARMGQLLGDPAEMQLAGKPLPHELKVIDRPNDRVDFRLLAHAFNGSLFLEFEEWRKSRRALVSLVRNRLGLVPPLPVLPEGIFRCIVADPPWQTDTGTSGWHGTIDAGHDALAFPKMSVEQIRDMKVADCAAVDAHLYLWTINKYVEQTYDIARAWGFKPSVLLVWAKMPRGIGLGDKYRLTTEFCLYARRGNLEEMQIHPTTWFNWPRGVHSEKPNEFYQLVEAMTPAPHAERDRIDIFARKERPGWTAWGDEIPCR